MSFYNMLFGMNPQSDLLLAVIGLRKNDVERFRDAHVGEDGKTISIYTRTGGGNRESYPNLLMRKLPGWRGSVDDDFDCTYCTDTFDIPAEFIDDVAGLSDIIGNGIRREFGQHLVKTLRREPSENDKETAAYEAEQHALSRTKHFMANGHTFVPMDDGAMRAALEIAEKNGGKLRSCWGICPLELTVKRDFHPYPKALHERDRQHFVRVEVGYDYGWKIDEAYWKHCQERWSSEFPLTMAEIAEIVERHRKAA